MNSKITLILVFVLSKSLYAQTKLESDLIITIALKRNMVNDTLVLGAMLKSLDSIERLSSSRRFRKEKKLEELRNYIAALEQVKWANLSCLGGGYSSLQFNSIAPNEIVILDTLETGNYDILVKGKSKAALARSNIEKKNSTFQKNQITMLANQQRILNDTGIKSVTLLRQLIEDQRFALETEHLQRWIDEQVQCKTELNESIRRLQIEVMKLKRVYASAYRRYLIN